MNTENSNQDRNSNELYTLLECVFCKGTGIVKYFDFNENNDLLNGIYDLNQLIKDKGTRTNCPEDCRVMN
tara:strand:- start:1038 stop:1247 length:210 start_codon:yes stop_codon:yes gene_type:complete